MGTAIARQLHLNISEKCDVRFSDMKLDLQHVAIMCMSIRPAIGTGRYRPSGFYQLGDDADTTTDWLLCIILSLFLAVI